MRSVLLVIALFPIVFLHYGAWERFVLIGGSGEAIDNAEFNGSEGVGCGSEF